MNKCVNKGCKFTLAALHLNNSNINHFLECMPSNKDIYVCVKHEIFHLCRDNMKIRTCPKLHSGSIICPISGKYIGIERDREEQTHLHDMSRTYSWHVMLNFESFQADFCEYVKSNQLACPENRLDSILQRLHTLCLAYHNMDIKSHCNEELAYSKFTTRLYILQELLKEHLLPGYISTYLSRCSEAKFCKHAAHLLSYDLSVCEESLLPPKHGQGTYMKMTSRILSWEKELMTFL